MRRPGVKTAGYLTVLLGSFVLATVAGWLGTPIDNHAYDWMFRRRQASWPPESIVLSIDEETLNRGGVSHMRRILAEGLDLLARAHPKVVAVDLILADAGDPAEDAALEAAFRRTPNLVLASDLMRNAEWEDPLPRFARTAAAIGHVHADLAFDGISRQVPLEKAAGRVRHWALALEAYRLSRGAAHITESPDDLEIGGAVVPAKWSDSRLMRIRFLPPAAEGRSAIPSISIAALRKNPGLVDRFRGKVVFAGVTAVSAAATDRFITPNSDGEQMPGVEIHAHIFETLAHGQFLAGASNLSVAGLCFLLALAAVAAFAFRSGWQSYALAALVLICAHMLPYELFARNVVFPYVAPLSAAWLAAVGAGTFQVFIVRRQLRFAEDERSRYQQAMHFVTHEMKTPLTAIQGSSELISRYPKLSDEKRKQIADLINAESKRLARMIETFLNVERLTAGQIDLKREIFPAAEVLDACLQRAQPLADRKQIRIEVGAVADAVLTGDRELMEYAVYNLLNNAVKYSPGETRIHVDAGAEDGLLRLSVTDQGIGMEPHELKRIFQKFYRTGRAVASGEKGTGIGLSIVQQIVALHGGRIEVTSEPGKGSCFTLVVPARLARHAAGSENA
jgi:signal transduction histidine kinase